MNGKGQVIGFQNALSHLQLTHDQFVSMCVAAGCDYLKNIKTIGIHKANQLVRNVNFLEDLQNHKYAPANYKESFLKARAVFRHQLVYNIEEKRVQPLTEWNESDNLQEKQACGQYLFRTLQYYY